MEQSHNICFSLGMVQKEPNLCTFCTNKLMRKVQKKFSKSNQTTMYLSSGDCLSGHPGQLAKAGGPRQRLQGHPGGELPLQAMITLELRWDLKVITKQLMLLGPSWG